MTDVVDTVLMIKNVVVFLRGCEAPTTRQGFVPPSPYNLTGHLIYGQ